ncbi:sigma-54-dependent transcriptional regulator [Oceanomicrobium pacificus]|uniref:Response regulator n=1 Tax=Oceanomicrobium pacificus TaxID=2692916 RepID=A0A6B0TWJ2_9RHOB|nr:sigma-54 dependent transcriptional regulator [Oceanomicrobium pacificus]MXU66115.1 response regulator [Oceanomicrobium pacificus]
MARQVLLVEDTASLALVYAAVLRRAGYGVRIAGTLAEGRDALDAQRPDLILLDLLLPDGDGRDLLTAARHGRKPVPVIVVTANGSIGRAVSAMQSGAADFLVKPFDESRLVSAVGAALAGAARPATGAAAARADLAAQLGAGPEVRAAAEAASALAPSTAAIFLTGERGAGKEILARHVHRLSHRADRPFVAVSCDNIDTTALEAEIFGTGARGGAVHRAAGGTLFLDEICDMGFETQARVLRFLQTSAVVRDGAAPGDVLDVRVICATSRDPETEVREGRFREDLFLRLHVVPIHLPPLRDRPKDIPALMSAILADAAPDGAAPKALSPDLACELAAAPWPVNLRQMRAVLTRACGLAGNGPITRDHIPDAVFRLRPPPAGRTAPAAALDALGGGPATRAIDLLVGATLADVERDLIEATIDACNGSLPRAAKLLGVSPSTLYRKRDAWMVG